MGDATDTAGKCWAWVWAAAWLLSAAALAVVLVQLHGLRDRVARLESRAEGIVEKYSLTVGTLERRHADELDRLDKALDCLADRLSGGKVRRVEGRVLRAAEGQLVVGQDGKGERTVTLTAETTFRAAGREGAPRDVRPGLRVWVLAAGGKALVVEVLP
jgi:hypothetical protein